MFSLLVTIISIALVAALALATLYYGGNAFNQGSANAEAAKLLNQGQQLLGAAALYKANTGGWPKDTAALVAGGYLRTTPVATTAVSEAIAEDSPWTMPKEYVPVFTVPSTVSAVCAKVNKTGYGIEGILADARGFVMTQCYGIDSAYTVAMGRAEGDVIAALPPIEVVTDPIPSPTDPIEWEVPPVTTVGGTGSGTVGTGPAPAGTDAAACLASTNTTNLDANNSQSAFGLYSTCTRALEVRAFTEHWGARVFYTEGYSASVNGDGMDAIVTVHSSPLSQGVDTYNAVSAASAGPLNFNLLVNLYGGAYVPRSSTTQEIGIGEYARFYATFSDISSPAPHVNTNTIPFEVKFADEPDSAYVAKPIVVSILPAP